METLTATELAVLSLTANQPEDLEHIYEHLHAPPRSIRLADAADAVKSLVEKGLLVSQLSEDGSLKKDVSHLWKARFAATENAKNALSDERPSPPPGWPKGRIYPGMFKGMIPDLSAEEIDEARREMWSGFAEDIPS